MVELLRPPVVTPGLYDLTAAQYHADPCPQPSLSHSVAKVIHRRSPRHAFNAHPRLGGKAGSGSSRDMALGTAAHAMALGKGAALVRIDAEDYRTAAAKQSRDAAFAQGFTPVLKSDWERAEAIAAPARYALEKFLGVKLSECLVEAAAITCVDGKWRRSLMDVISPDLRTIIDYKTTEDASEDAAQTRIRGLSYDTQDAFYRQQLDTLDPDGTLFRRVYFMFQERDCPEAITFHELDAAAIELAQGKMARAEKRWGECLDANEWPAYDIGPHFYSPRPWEMDDAMLVTEAAP